MLKTKVVGITSTDSPGEVLNSFKSGIGREVWICCARPYSQRFCKLRQQSRQLAVSSLSTL
jgi:hypothetical protein